MWLIKTDASGYMQWNQTFGGAGSDRGVGLVEAPDGGYVIAGLTKSVGAGDPDFWLVKTSEMGVVPENTSWLAMSLVLAALAPILYCGKRLLRAKS